MLVTQKLETSLKTLPYSTTSEDTKNTDTLTDKTSANELKVGDVFFGSITTNTKDSNGKSTRTKPIGTYKIVSERCGSNNTSFIVEDKKGNQLKTSKNGISIKKYTSNDESLQKLLQQKEEEEEAAKAEEEMLKNAIDLDSLETEEKLKLIINAGIKNIWMVGPAGCGKSTIARITAKELDRPYLCISCGIGTSATEFLGYKYPSRESTKFADYYSKPSIILIDEMTALDPAVGQVLNAALANDEIETTTGTVCRHPDCIIIATSNTFGTGANRQYVANNQLDASTIDRFIGGILEVDYSTKYESTFDKEVVTFVYTLRSIIKINNLRRVASTRMIQSGSLMKKAYFTSWKEMLIVNWTESEKEIVKAQLEQITSNAERYKHMSALYKPIAA